LVRPIVSQTVASSQSGTEELIDGLEYSFRGAGAKSSAKIQWVDAQAGTGGVALSQGFPFRVPLNTGGEPSGSSEASKGSEQSELFAAGSPGGAPRRRRLSAENPKTSALINAAFVLARNYALAAQLHAQLVNAVKQRKMHRILEVVRIIDGRVNNIVPLTEKGMSVVYVDTGGAQLIPLSLMGAGFFNALNIAAMIVVSGSKVVLIDEIEDGIHYLAYPALARSFFDIISESDVQIFITTHSDEFISAFAEASEVKDFNSVASFHFRRFVDDRGRDVVNVSRYNKDEIISSRELQLELR
jgi:hypothetical protein